MPISAQGIAVLAFEVGPNVLPQIYERYSTLHSKLLPDEYAKGVKVYENEACMFEVYAYYKGDQKGGEHGSAADVGTRLRFLEPIGGSNTSCKLPGLVPVPAEFGDCHPAYFDHWVSNGESEYCKFLCS